MSKLLKFLDFSCFAEARPAGAGSKKCTFFDTFSLTWTNVRFFRECHSELDSCPFDPTLVSAASSVTERQIETRVGPKGPERSSGRHLRVQKWRKKVNFLAKSSGKNGVSLWTDRGRTRQSSSAPRASEKQTVPGRLQPPALQYSRLERDFFFTKCQAKRSFYERFSSCVTYSNDFKKSYNSRV